VYTLSLSKDQKNEPGFYVQRTDVEGRFQRYTIQSYAVQAKPAGSRY